VTKATLHINVTINGESKDPTVGCGESLLDMLRRQAITASKRVARRADAVYARSYWMVGRCGVVEYRPSKRMGTRSPPSRG
jgi:hypothetical protein